MMMIMPTTVFSHTFHAAMLYHHLYVSSEGLGMAVGLNEKHTKNITNYSLNL